MTTISKQAFIDLLTAELPEGENRQALINAARHMIPSDFNRSQLAAIHNCSSVQRAMAAYKALVPEANITRPAIDHLVAWLIDAGAVVYASTLEKKLTAINKTSMIHGVIHPGGEYSLSFNDLIALRINSSEPPRLMW